MSIEGTTESMHSKAEAGKTNKMIKPTNNNRQEQPDKSSLTPHLSKVVQEMEAPS